MEYTGADNLEIMNAAVNYNQFLLRCVLDQAQGRQKLLDFGAGLGTFAQKVKDHGFDVSCFEVDPEFSQKLHTKGFPTFSKEEAVPAGAFDLIFSLNVIEHLADDTRALRNFHQWLRPGGKLVLYVPAFMHLFSSMDKKVGHFRRYGRSELIEKTHKAGFRHIRCEFVDSIGYLASLGYKYFKLKDGRISEREVAAYDRYAFPVSRLIDRFTNRLGGKNLLLTADRD